MTQRFFHDLAIGQQFRYVPRNYGVYTKLSDDSAELVPERPELTPDGSNVTYYFASTTAVLLIPTEDK